MFKHKIVFLLFVFCVSCSLTCFSQETTLKKIDVITFVEANMTGMFLKKLKEEFGKAGLVEGKDFSLRVRSAQGEMSVLPTLIDSVVADKSDLLIAMNGPVLQTAIQRAPKSTIVFSILSDPFVLGAGKSDTEHLANVTGTYLVNPAKELFEGIASMKPAIKKLGCLVASSDMNSMSVLEKLQDAAKKQNIELVKQPYDTVGDIFLAAQALGEKGIDGFVQLTDVFHSMTSASLIKVAQAKKIPVFGLTSNYLAEGFLMAAYPDREKAGQQFVEIALKVFKGENPGKIPFQNNANLGVFYKVNEKVAAELGITIPEALLQKAKQ
ncbi:MAG: ABC transporter substrate-binding protein [Candidatus Ozemobacteraceae bacterium]